MSYTPTTWTTGDTITATAMNKIENGIANAGGGFDLVIKMSTLTPESYSTFEVVSGDTAENLYDKLMDGTPLTIMIIGYNLSGVYATSLSWVGSAFTTSVTDTIFIRGISTPDVTWASYQVIQYDSNGVAWQ